MTYDCIMYQSVFKKFYDENSHFFGLIKNKPEFSDMSKTLKLMEIKFLETSKKIDNVIEISKSYQYENMLTSLYAKGNEIYSDANIHSPLMGNGDKNFIEVHLESNCKDCFEEIKETIENVMKVPFPCYNEIYQNRNI